jgi:hypothetical protein
MTHDITHDFTHDFTHDTRLLTHDTRHTTYRDTRDLQTEFAFFRKRVQLTQQQLTLCDVINPGEAAQTQCEIKNVVSLISVRTYICYMIF